jgi:CHAD domain-containing protein
MAFKLRPNEPIQSAFHSVVASQLTGALAELSDPQLSTTAKVHQVRRRCKKIRGVLRLFRYSLNAETYKAEDAHFRNAARLVADLRDADVMLQVFDTFRQHHALDCKAAACDSLRHSLQAIRSEAHDDQIDAEARLQQFQAAFVQALERLATWKIDEKRFRTIKDGLSETYRRGRKGLADIRVQATVERLHEWRKQVKYHWFHVRMLRDCWKTKLKPRAADLKSLADRLGDDHDLAMLSATLQARLTPAEVCGEFGPVFAAIERCRSELQTASLSLGKDLYRQSAKRFTRRVQKQWRQSRSSHEKPAE